MTRKEFNWEEFLSSDEIAVSCKTKNQAIDFCKQMHEHGLRWKSGLSYLEFTNWDANEKELSYYSDGECSTKDYCIKHNHTVLEWFDYMPMKHQEVLRVLLKPGYVVVHEDNSLSKVERNKNGKLILSGEKHCCLFADIQEDFSIKNDAGGMIKEIYGYSNSKYDAYRLSLEGRNCVWKREPLKEFDEEEMNQDELER